MAGMAVDYVRVVWRCAMTETSKQWFCSVTTVYIDVVVISVKSTCTHTFSFSEGTVFVCSNNNTMLSLQ